MSDIKIYVDSQGNKRWKWKNKKGAIYGKTAMPKNKCFKELLAEYHKIQPIRAINKYNSRFAYKIIVKGKPISGEYELVGVDAVNKSFKYKRIGCK